MVEYHNQKLLVKLERVGKLEKQQTKLNSPAGHSTISTLQFNQHAEAQIAKL